MKYTYERSSKNQTKFIAETAQNSGVVSSKIVMCPVFIDQEEERMFTKRANECMRMRKWLTIKNT